MQSLVVLEGVGLSRGGTSLLRDIDIEIGPGEAVGVSGANGSGKTTLLRLIATLIRPDRGNGSVLGAALATPETRRVRGTIGLIGHEPALIPDLTLTENLDHIARLSCLGEHQGILAAHQAGPSFSSATKS